MVSAGADQTITVPATAALNGIVSDDGLPNPPGVLLLSWTQMSGSGSTIFANASQASTMASFSTSGIYTLRLTASDSVRSTSDKHYDGSAVRS